MKTYQNPSDIFDDPTAPLFPLQLAVFPLPKKTSSQNITLSSPSWQPLFFFLQTPLFLLFLPSSVRVFLRKPTILCYTSPLPPPKQPTRKPSEKKQKIVDLTRNIPIPLISSQACCGLRWACTGSICCPMPRPIGVL